MTDNRMTELQEILDRFEHECFMLRTEASDTRAKDDVVRMSYKRIRDEFAERIVGTLGRIRYEKDELERFAKRVEDAVNNCEDLTLFGRDYMLLPVDADGVPIHVGDIMEGVDKHDTLRNVKGEVIEICFHATDSEGLVASVALQVWAPDGKSWHRSYIDPYANVYRHVKPRTLEDVLRNVMQFGHDDNTVGELADAVVDKYAAEIRELLGDDAE